MRFLILIGAIFSLSLSSAAFAQPSSDLDYLPKDVSYDPSIPKPADVLGYPVGTWHVRHDQLVTYMKTLAEASPRISLIETGKTHEQRPLLLLQISAEKNIANLEQIRTAHINRIANNQAADPNKDPMIIWMGYSVHGDEASGSNASMLVAYYLAAGRGEKIDQLLNDNIVLLDPSINPDGLARFAHWANSHRGETLVDDPNHVEHVQRWPSGRTNHYWFDLNRDWLLTTHPESRARINQFHRWRPNVLTDFHEMGTNSTYFFQPGIPSRKNPNTPDTNLDLTETLAGFHAKALDKNNRLYFTEESFDDFYYGKGSTYPDVHGAVGILFEQASSRGHVQASQNGPVSFPFAIQNQFTTSLSTFEGSLANKAELLAFQHQSGVDVADLVKKDKVAGFVVSESHDKQRMQALLDILNRHQIKFQSLRRNVSLDGQRFEAQDSYYISLDQPQYRLIKSLFSTRTRFNDNTFYDVSNWNLPLSFNIRYTAVSKGDQRKFETSDASQSAQVSNQLKADSYAYAFSWDNYSAPKLLQQALNAGLKVKVAGRAFVAETDVGQINFAPGSIVFPRGLNQPAGFESTLTQLANNNGIKVWSVQSGLTGQGIDLGSRNMMNLDKVKVMIVGGVGTSQYEVGEAWHYLDTRVGMPVSIVDRDRLGQVDLSSYTHMIFVQGNYSGLSESVTDKIDYWLKQGGVLIGQKSASRWFSNQEWLKAKFLSRSDIDDAFNTEGLKYGDIESLNGKKRIAGAAFATDLDLTHPLAFGFYNETLPIFRNSTSVMQLPNRPFVTVAKYTDKPLMAGYTATELEDTIADSAAIVAHNVGRGKVIAFTDDLNFRGYWYGTSRLLSNAIFMSGFIDAN
ncbi:peptidase M14 [Alteromonadaceae bacterium M269]|nr:peptidase M14 [Alteromonadaceae bacterium M269]